MHKGRHHHPDAREVRHAARSARGASRVDNKAGRLRPEAGAGWNESGGDAHERSVFLKCSLTGAAFYARDQDYESQSALFTKIGYYSTNFTPRHLQLQTHTPTPRTPLLDGHKLVGNLFGEFLHPICRSRRADSTPSH